LVFPHDRQDFGGERHANSILPSTVSAALIHRGAKSLYRLALSIGWRCRAGELSRFRRVNSLRALLDSLEHEALLPAILS
jgi:hypothetical protein